MLFGAKPILCLWFLELILVFRKLGLVWFLLLCVFFFFPFFCLPWYAWIDYAFVKIDFTRTIIIIIVFYDIIFFYQ